MGWKGPRAKAKIVLKSVSKVDQLGSMHNFKFQTFLNKNPPNTGLDLNTSGRELDVKEGGVALPVGDQVGGDAGVEAGAGLGDVLDDESLVSENNSTSNVLINSLSLGKQTR